MTGSEPKLDREQTRFTYKLPQFSDTFLKLICWMKATQRLEGIRQYLLFCLEFFRIFHDGLAGMWQAGQTCRCFCKIASLPNAIKNSIKPSKTSVQKKTMENINFNLYPRVTHRDFMFQRKKS